MCIVFYRATNFIKPKHVIFGCHHPTSPCFQAFAAKFNDLLDGPLELQKYEELVYSFLYHSITITAPF